MPEPSLQPAYGNENKELSRQERGKAGLPCFAKPSLVASLSNIDPAYIPRSEEVGLYHDTFPPTLLIPWGKLELG